MIINFGNTGGGSPTPAGASGDYRVVSSLSAFTSPKNGSIAFVPAHTAQEEMTFDYHWVFVPTEAMVNASLNYTPMLFDIWAHYGFEVFCISDNNSFRYHGVDNGAYEHIGEWIHTGCQYYECNTYYRVFEVDGYDKTVYGLEAYCSSDEISNPQEYFSYSEYGSFEDMWTVEQNVTKSLPVYYNEKKYLNITNTWYHYDDVIVFDDLTDTEKATLFDYVYNNFKVKNTSFIPTINFKKDGYNVPVSVPYVVDTGNVEIQYRYLIDNNGLKSVSIYWRNDEKSNPQIDANTIAIENKFTFTLDNVQTGQWYREQIFSMIQKGATSNRNTNIELVTWDDTAGEFTEGAKLMCYKIENYKSSDNKIFNGWFNDNGVICLMRFKRSEFLSYKAELKPIVGFDNYNMISGDTIYLDIDSLDEKNPTVGFEDESNVNFGSDEAYLSDSSGENVLTYTYSTGELKNEEGESVSWDDVPYCYISKDYAGFISLKAKMNISDVSDIQDARIWFTK